VPNRWIMSTGVVTLIALGSITTVSGAYGASVITSASPQADAELDAKIADAQRAWVTAPQVLRLVVKYFPAKQVGNAMSVAGCESFYSAQKSAANTDGSTDWGIFQLNDNGTLQTALKNLGLPSASLKERQLAVLDSETNVRAAAQIWVTEGWAPWTCSAKNAIVAKLYTNEPGVNYSEFNRWGYWVGWNSAEGSVVTIRKHEKAKQAKIARAETKARAKLLRYELARRGKL